MKCLLLFAGGLLAFSPLSAQILGNGDVVERDITHREYILNKNSVNNLNASEWSREVYREVNEYMDENTPLFNLKDQNNLTSLIFNLISDGKLKAYTYEPNRSPDFDKEIGLQDVVNANNIHFSTEINEISVNVMSYLIKERWYFDSKTGKGGAQIVAICPVLHRSVDPLQKDKVSKSPLFWISFEKLSPYILRTTIPLASIGNIAKGQNTSLFDYIRNRRYTGDIYQVGSRNLSDYYTTPQALAAERARLEAQLKELSQRFAQLK